MKKLLFIFSVVLFSACQKDDNVNDPVSTYTFELEHFLINGKEIPLKANTYLIDTSASSSIMLSSTTSMSNYIVLNYAWVSATEKLTSVALSCKNGTVAVKQETKNDLTTYTIDITNATPKAELHYTISTSAK